MFYFSLALRLGKTVKQLLSEIDSRELTEWQAFLQIMNEDPQRPAPEGRAVEATLVEAFGIPNG